MSSLKAIICAAVLTAPVLATSNSCTNPVYQILANYEPAVDYCAKQYPQAVVTVKDPGTAPCITPRAQIDAASLERRTGDDVFWSSFKKEAASVLSAACRCINTSRTTTVYANTPKNCPPKTPDPWENTNPTSTSSAPTTRRSTTKKSTTSSTRSNATTKGSSVTTRSDSSTSTQASTTTSSQSRLTTTSTQSSSSTTTSRSSSTTTTPAVTCPGGRVPSPIPKQCTLGSCNSTPLKCISANFPTCQSQCDNTPGCVSVQQPANSLECTLYSDCTCPTTCGTDRPFPAQRDCQPGSCDRPEINCSLQKDNSACQNKCNNTPGCYAVNYNGNNDYCVTYGQCACPTTCGSTRPAPVQRDCQPGTCNRPEIDCTLQSSNNNCQQHCNQVAGCYAVNYNPQSGQCVTYGQCTCPTTCGTDRPAPALKDCQPGTCSRKEIECSLQPSNTACQQHCNTVGGCIAVNYNGLSGQCVTYGDCTCPTTCSNDRPAPALKDCQPGTCSRPEIECSLQASNPTCQQHCNTVGGCIAVNYNGLSGQCVTYGECTCPKA